MYNNQINYYQPYSNQPIMNGGYPNMGYPPQMPQIIDVSHNGYDVYAPTQQNFNSQYSPFINPPVVQQNIQQPGLPQPYWTQNVQNNFQQSPSVPFTYVPGANGPIEAHRADGQVDLINIHNQGGSTVSAGGFNPVTQTNSPSAAQSGFVNNPYSRFHGQYQAPMPNYNYNGFFPMYGQNQFDRELNEILYNEDVSFYDPMGALEEVLLTDEERDKLNKNRQLQFSGYDYYGRPIYNNYAANAQQQEALQQARLNTQLHFTKLSKICHAYFGETINEDEMMKRFDPIKEAPKPAPMTAQEREYNQKIQWVEYCNELERKLNYEDQMDEYKRILKMQCFQKIKDSHDRMLGVTPGEHYDFKTFANNGYKILAHAFVENGRRRLKDASKKYDSRAFRSSIAINTNRAVPVQTKDEDYVSVEERLKRIYEKNKTPMMALPDGSFAFAIAPPGVDQEVYRQRLFKEALERKRKKDEATRAMGQ